MRRLRLHNNMPYCLAMRPIVLCALLAAACGGDEAPWVSDAVMVLLAVGTIVATVLGHKFKR